MNYTDTVFPIFFAITFVLYYLAPREHIQVTILVAASLFFYAWEAPAVLGIFLTSWLITSLSSWGVMKSRQRKAVYATLGVVANLALLFFFKYKFLFLSHLDANSPGTTLGRWLLLAPLPIGISFYTFHGLSLLVDIFRGRNPETFERDKSLARHMADTLLYLVFFPQLIAGPIIKAKDFYPQVKRKRIQEVDFQGSARILILGLFLKTVVADNLSEQTYWITYPYFLGKSSADLLLLLYGYSAQIFADFAGYSLVAIGLARLLGYRLPDNFNFPYIASSIGDFWRRWHISLSSWLRDYLYIPLGGNQKGSIRTYVNLIIVMFLGGLWHGAAWSFAVWGLWHGAGLALERGWRESRFLTTVNPWVLLFRIVLVFHFVTLGWLLFKLQEFGHAVLYFKSLFAGGLTRVSPAAALLICGYGSSVLLYHLFHQWRERISPGVKNVLYGVMLFLVIVSPGPSTPFIYFQF
ncbi:MAG: MBOAT family protein [Verrucomicrobiae bacterium]|nr:MBOAT family protein [Verrucomicrobiae bacterium]